MIKNTNLLISKDHQTHFQASSTGVYTSYNFSLIFQKGSIHVNRGLVLLQVHPLLRLLILVQSRLLI